MRTRWSTILLAVSAVWMWAAASVGAQAHPNPAVYDSARRIQEMEPRSGPPGTEISIYTENLPLQGRVVLGMGAVGEGFEALGEAQQEEWGEVGGTIIVPDYATWDRALVVIIFNGNFAPTGLSDPFHVTDENGLIRRSGWITQEGEGDCVVMRDQDGYFYTLAGDLADGLTDAEPGTAVTVEGRFIAKDRCPRGETIEIERLVGAHQSFLPVAPSPAEAAGPYRR